jgi:hypothetical protein
MNKSNLNERKKTITLLLFFLVGGVLNSMAEEIVGKIMFEPELVSVSSYESYLQYYLDTTGDLIVDRRMSLSTRNGETVYKTLSMYLEKGWGVVFEDKELRPLQDFSAACITAIISPENRRIELTQMFSRDVINQSFIYLRN